MRQLARSHSSTTSLAATTYNDYSLLSVLLLLYYLQAPEARVKIVRQLARMLETIKAPAARASIVWMVGSYHHLVPKIAPDALRELAKSFKTEEAQVKLQVLNLACKLYLSEPVTCEKLFRYVMDMARYDMVRQKEP
jgi:AP-3 complex subunit beta